MNILKYLGIGVASTSYVAARYGFFGSNTIHFNDIDDTKSDENNTILYKHFETQNLGIIHFARCQTLNLNHNQFQLTENIK